MKNIGCIGCHQLGQEATRTIPAQFGHFKTGEEAWMRRVQSGQAGEEMIERRPAPSAARRCKYLGDWTDRIAKGELPHDQAAAAAGRRAQHRHHRRGNGGPRRPTCTT